MTGKERIEAVLAGKVPDRVPWVPLVARYYVMSLPAMGYAIEDFAPRNLTKHKAVLYDYCLAEIQAARLSGGDIFYRHVYGYSTYSDDCKLTTHTSPGKTTRIWETPLGELSETIEVKHGSDYFTKNMIQNEQDLRAFLYLMESMQARPAYEDMPQFLDFIGDDGIATYSGPVTPIQDLLQFKMGVQNTFYAMYDQPENMQKVFSAIQQLNRSIYQILGDAPTGKVVITYDDTSTTVISPDWYSQYEAPHLNEYADILLERGKIPIAHMCGKLSLITNLLAQDRYIGIDSVCPPETGDLEPGDALKQTGKLIIGGLEPVLLTQMDADETYRYATEKLQQVADCKAFNRFMLCSGDSVAAGTPMENLRAVTRAVKDFSIADHI
jgi:uroporphyrinogen-III decarboxylase